MLEYALLPKGVKPLAVTGDEDHRAALAKIFDLLNDVACRDMETPHEAPQFENALADTVELMLKENLTTEDTILALRLSEIGRDFNAAKIYERQYGPSVDRVLESCMMRLDALRRWCGV